MLQSQNYPSYRKKVLQYQQSAMGNHTTSTSHSQGNLRGVNATEFNGGRDIMGNRQSWLATNQYKHQQNGKSANNDTKIAVAGQFPLNLEHLI